MFLLSKVKSNANRTKIMETDDEIKDRSQRGVVSAWWLAGALAASGAAVLLALLADSRLPAALPPSDPLQFSGLAAHAFLVNLTAIGPRVAGTYENEVLAVRVVLEALRRAAAGAAPHHRVDTAVHTASGAFSLSFMDGMNNAYRDVQSVVARVSVVGAARRERDALLLNCHYDTVPDSPGASDDGAGCAVVLETLRLLAAGPALPRDLVVLFNGAEENIMQASHAFVTTHPWARRLRAFINVEACGAGGREVLFQAGPAPWVAHVYAAAAPHPFASSVAQELFESGLVPADTDFRVFRDFGNLSGLDLAWASAGHVYHTRLDVAAGVPPAALQRTGHNVASVARALLAASGREGGAALPVYFDVLGVLLVTAEPRAALLLAAAVLLAVLAAVHADAGRARTLWYMRRRAWWALCARQAAGALGAAAGALLLSAALAHALHAAGLRLPYYARPWLVLPLYGAPALGAAALLAARLAARAPPAPAALAALDALLLLWGGALALAVLRGLRSGFVPLLWAGAGAASAAAGAGRARALLGALLAAPPALLSASLAVGLLKLAVPVAGRAGAGAVPVDVLVAALTAALSLLCCGWAAPLLALAPPRAARWLAALAAGALAAGVLLAALGEPYSATHPLRLMVFHTRRTTHTHTHAQVEHVYWIPLLDVNTQRELQRAGGALGAARPAECGPHAYCGAPYYLPVWGLVPAALAAPAPAALPPRAALALDVALRPRGAQAELTLSLQGPPHAVLVLAPARGVRLVACDLLALRRAADWQGRPTYFLALHTARPPHAWRLRVTLQREAPGEGWVHVSAAGHAMGTRGPAHEALLAALPPHVAATGWAADLHLYHL